MVGLLIEAIKEQQNVIEKQSVEMLEIKELLKLIRGTNDV
jgi:hypothetical protein